MKHLFLKCLSPIAIVMCSLSPLMLGSCSSGGIVFANYESYMSPDLIDKNRTVDGQQVRYVSYSTNEDIQAKFKRSYDLAVPSTYTVLELVKADEVAELNWAMFSTEGHKLNSNEYRWPLITYPSYLIEYAKPYNSYQGATTDDKMLAARNDPHNALTLFSDTVINIIFSVDDYAHDHGYYGVGKTLLNYSLPYFDQDLMFAYHGDYIGNEMNNDGGAYQLTAPQLNEDGLWYSEGATWDKITNAISPKKNTTLDSRFIPNERQHMALVDDSRTFYDLCRLASTGGADVNPPDDAAEQTMEKIGETYGHVSNKFNPNTFFINSDSQQILYSFADPVGDYTNATEAQANAIISYSGDVAYATMGGGNDDWTDTWHCEPKGQDALVDGNVHIVKPRNTMVALDMLVINKKDQDKQSVYDLAKSCVLDGADAAPTSTDDPNAWIGKGITDDDATNDPLYNTILNFEYTYYEPTLWNTKEFVSRNSNEPDATNSYYDIKYSDENKAELLAEINNVNFLPGDQLLELPLSSLAKSNMSFEYMQYKQKM